MRSKNAVKNLILSLAYEGFIFIAGIVAPRFVILTYGSAINGLTASINRLLMLINLIQAGAVGSAIYQMYKPVASDDFENQSAIIYASNKFYNRVGKIYLFLATVIAIIYGLYLKNDNLSIVEIIYSFLLLAGNGCIYLFFTAKYDIVFSAYQKKYILIIGSLIEKITYYTLLVFVFIGKVHFTFMYIAMSIGSLVGLAFNTYMYKRITNNKISNNPKNKNFVIPDRKYLMATSIATEGISALPTIIITSILGLIFASVFSVYQMIYSSIKTVINSIQLSISAIFGNLVASEKEERIYQVHKLLELVFMMIGSFLASCTAYLLLPFVKLYTAGIADANYLYTLLIIFVVFYVIIFTFRTSFGYVATVYGLFKDICMITLVFGGIGMLLSILATVFLGLPYVMMGVLFYEASSAILTLIVVQKKVNWFNYKKMPQRTSILLGIPVLFYLVGLRGLMIGNGWLGWVATAFVCATISFMMIILYCVLFERKELITLLNYGKNFLRKRGYTQHV